MITVPDDLKVPPSANAGGEISVSFEDSEVQIQLSSKGVLSSLPTLKLLVLGGVFLVAGLYILGVNVWMSYKDGLAASMVPFLAAALMLWIASIPLRTAFRSAQSSVIVISKHGIALSRSASKSGTEIPWADAKSVLITDVMKVAFELIIITPAHRVVQIAAGRSINELTWIAQVMEACRPRESDIMNCHH